MANTPVWQLANAIAKKFNERYKVSHGADFRAIAGEEYNSFMQIACGKTANQLEDAELAQAVMSATNSHVAAFVANFKKHAKEQMLVVLSHPRGRNLKHVSVELVCRKEFEQANLVKTVIDEAKKIVSITALLISPSQNNEEVLTTHYTKLGFTVLEPGDNQKQPVLILEFDRVAGGVAHGLPQSWQNAF